MAFNYLVHIVNPVSGWVVTQVHVVADDTDTAIKRALTKFGIDHGELGQTLKAIPQVVGGIVEEEAETANATVEADPIPETKAAVVSEAEQTAANVLASLPADVLAAVQAALEKK